MLTKFSKIEYFLPKLTVQLTFVGTLIIYTFILKYHYVMDEQQLF